MGRRKQKAMKEGLGFTLKLHSKAGRLSKGRVKHIRMTFHSFTPGACAAILSQIPEQKPATQVMFQRKAKSKACYVTEQLLLVDMFKIPQIIYLFCLYNTTFCFNS